MFNFSGAVGILVMGAVGGWAFDHFGPVSPFIIVGVLNGLVGVAALVSPARGSVKPAAGTL
jgi:F0F1-type ATP synthase assembly protein I